MDYYTSGKFVADFINYHCPGKERYVSIDFFKLECSKNGIDETIANTAIKDFQTFYADKDSVFTEPDLLTLPAKESPFNDVYLLEE